MKSVRRNLPGNSSECCALHGILKAQQTLDHPDIGVVDHLAIDGDGTLSVALGFLECSDGAMGVSDLLVGGDEGLFAGARKRSKPRLGIVERGFA